MLKIAIDAGHYQKTPGRRCLAALDPNQTREWELNRRVADELQELLTGYECETIRVDDTTGAHLVSLADRVKAANGWPADVYLSIHHNAGVKGGSGGGCVVYTAPNCQAKSRALQKAVYGAVISRTGLVGNRSNVMPERSLYVLQHTTMPAILIECGFMDSSTDAPVILTAYFPEQVADGLIAALREVFGLKEKPKPAKVNPYHAPTRTLKKGARGEDVKWLQWELADRGYSCAVDGSFGPATLAAVKAYQRDQVLAVDGSVGPKTRAELQK